MKKILLILSLGGALTSWSSDHIDGPATTQHEVTDLTDLYVFPVEGSKDKISLVLNTYPLFRKNGHFSEKVQYEFFLQRLEKKKSLGKFVEVERTSLLCSFQSASHHGVYTMKCESENGMRRSVISEQRQSFGDFKSYTGMRSDPFFLNTKFFGALVQKGKFIKSNAKNAMKNLNCLSIVLEINPNDFFDGHEKHSLYGVAARSITHFKNPREQFDWVGRAELGNIILEGRDAVDLRDQYNVEKHLGDFSQNKAIYLRRLQKSIQLVDSI